MPGVLWREARQTAAAIGSLLAITVAAGITWFVAFRASVGYPRPPAGGTPAPDLSLAAASPQEDAD